jgi:hypothetical protein
MMLVHWRAHSFANSGQPACPGVQHLTPSGRKCDPGQTTPAFVTVRRLGSICASGSLGSPKWQGLRLHLTLTRVLVLFNVRGSLLPQGNGLILFTLLHIPIWLRVTLLDIPVNSMTVKVCIGAQNLVLPRGFGHGLGADCIRTFVGLKFVIPVWGQI